mmetsp:Transcript_24528/g.81545  ORF Transcript_24528/g.81545 Transcript_24528/m.81545 type:complete len:211 (+) Transcript_24528:124-756(+)
MAIDAAQGREVGGHILGQIRARDAEARFGLLVEDVPPVPPLEYAHHLAGAADGGDAEELGGGPRKVGGREVEPLVVALLGVELRVPDVAAAAVEAGGEQQQLRREGAQRGEHPLRKRLPPLGPPAATLPRRDKAAAAAARLWRGELTAAPHRGEGHVDDVLRHGVRGARARVEGREGGVAGVVEVDRREEEGGGRQRRRQAPHYLLGAVP